MLFPVVWSNDSGFKLLTVTVSIGVAEDHDEVHKHPDSASAEGQEHGDSGRGPVGVEPVDPEPSEEEAEEESDEPALVEVFSDDSVAAGRRHIAGLGIVRKICAASRAEGSRFIDLLSASWTIRHSFKQLFKFM